MRKRAAEQNSPSIETLKRMAAFMGGEVKLDKDKYFLNFDAGDFGYDTQYYKIDGGMWVNSRLTYFTTRYPITLPLTPEPFLGSRL